jgi:hypothetical protein
MNLASKVFKNNITGDVVKVIDSFENIAILENKQKIDVRSLMDSNQYTEQVDPSSFFNNQSAYNFLAEKIKNIPTNMLADDDENVVRVNPYNGDGFGPVSNESAIIMSSEEEEKAELAKKYGVINNNDSVQKQNQAFAKLLGEEETVTKIEVNNNEEETYTIEKRPVSSIPKQVTTPPQTKKVEDPIISMFSKTKRNVDFKINIEVSNKIPRLDFIEMMEDSYETSIIDFLTDDITNKILNDPSMIRESIKSKIKQLVYGSVNSQITDSVTQVEKHESLSFEKEPVLSKDLIKPKTTRKTNTDKTKKEVIEK